MRIGIITDHDKDNHSRFNSRTSPINGSFCLPKNFTLLYARSDAGIENILNWLLDKCEKDAKAILDALHKNGRINIRNKIVSIDNIATADVGEF
jgi:metal-dependent hydrolase (beta-lactamase superfamily II)